MLAIRRLIQSESKWVDKDVKRHKHDYSQEACVTLIQPHMTTYYHVVKCLHCNSFKSIPKEGSSLGLISNPIPNLPTIKLRKSSKTIGYKDAQLVRTLEVFRV